MIDFQTYNVDLPNVDFDLVRCWIKEVTLRHDRTLGPLTYLFCDDPHIIEINRQFLNHDFFTDVITFDYTRKKRISGDIVISLDTVASNALKLEEDYFQELHRVIIHGVLHLCGINDKGEGEREIMELHENDALAHLNEMKENR